MTKIRNCAHPNCIVCSLANTAGFNIDFDVMDNNEIKAEIRFDSHCEGYHKMMHGGVISTILDGAMTNCIFAQGHTAVTVEMNIRFRHPVSIEEPVTVIARVANRSYPLYYMESELLQNGEVKATGKAKFYEQPHFTQNCN